MAGKAGFSGRKKGTPRTGGRLPGSGNKTPKQIAQAIIDSFDELGGVKYLVQVGKERPDVYASLLRAILPRDVNINGDIKLTPVTKIELVPVHPVTIDHEPIVSLVSKVEEANFIDVKLE